MAKINHSRPSLKMIDNWEREHRKEFSRYKLETPRSVKFCQAPKNQKETEVFLTEVELSKLFELFGLSNTYLDLEIEMLSLVVLSSKNRKSKRVKLQKVIDEEFNKLVRKASDILLIDYLECSKGRANGLDIWLIQFGKYIKDKHPDMIDWYKFISETVFEAATRRVIKLTQNLKEEI